jgi:hypothetical protein
MSVRLSSGDVCPKCRKPMMQAVIEAHPTRPDLALQNFQCGDCGPVRTNILSLKPGKSSPELAVSIDIA